MANYFQISIFVAKLRVGEEETFTADMQKGGKMNQCDVCEEVGLNDCINCYLGNPCLDCVDYDKAKHICMSDGGCAERREDAK